MIPVIPELPEYEYRAFNTETGTMGEPFTLKKAIGSRSVNGVPTDGMIYLASTGHRDIRKRKIFAGDIVELISQRNRKHPDRTPRKVVEWNPERGGWNITGRTKVEIVGNVFEVTV